MSSRMLRFKSFNALPQSLRSRLRDTFAKSSKAIVRARPVRGRAQGDERNYSFELYEQLVAAGLPKPIREYHFDQQETDGRGWAFDLCWPELRFAVEVDGAVHRIKERFKRDMERHQKACLAGWMVLRVAPFQVDNGEAIHLVRMGLTLAQGPQGPLLAGR